jgi:beta-glucosidase-like glycosyl hydrolase
VDRAMNWQRRAGESARDFAAFTAHVPALAGVPVLVAVDRESWGIKRLHPCRQAIEARVRAVMTGPAVLEAIDNSETASTSGNVMRILRQQLGFSGLIVSDDLDGATALPRKLLSNESRAIGSKAL